jgi:hypothetical protein
MSNPDLRPSSDEEWQELLRQLQLLPKAQPQPFFYARVHARLSAPRTTPFAWLHRPAYAALLGALILAVSGDGAALRAAPAASHPSQLSRSPTR